LSVPVDARAAPPKPVRRRPGRRGDLPLRRRRSAGNDRRHRRGGAPPGRARPSGREPPDPRSDRPGEPRRPRVRPRRGGSNAGFVSEFNGLARLSVGLGDEESRTWRDCGGPHLDRPRAREPSRAPPQP
ncbi:MAG: hypothetical protein ACK56I_18275, partial [bacterium]